VLHSHSIFVPRDTRRIYLEPTWTIHGFQHQMISSPPKGYEFVVARKRHEDLFKVLAHQDTARSLLMALDAVVPTTLAKSFLQKWSDPPAGTVLTYSIDHLIFRREPWVVEVEYASALAGTNPAHLKRFRGIVETTLASPYCRRIILWSEAGKKSLLTDLHSQGFEHKCRVIPLAVPPKAFVKKNGNGRIKLLFVGSGSSKGVFEWRGSGIFEVFAALRKRYGNLELVVRSDVPKYLKDRYRSLENVRILDTPLPREVVEHEFESADIFIFPSYTTAPLTILEAMSYELPIVTIDAWANAEYVEDGKTGLVVSRSTEFPYYYADTLQPNFLAPEFTRALRNPDRRVVNELIMKTSLLIDSPDSRRRLGKAARAEVETGRFSAVMMNSRLAQVFAEAIDGTADKP
jgi:glycosyltransferase involved in cell wall biosynthesis